MRNDADVLCRLMSNNHSIIQSYITPTHGATTLSIMTLSITTISIIINKKLTLSVMAVSVTTISKTMICHYAELNDDKCRDLCFIMLVVIMLSVVILSVVVPHS